MYNGGKIVMSSLYLFLLIGVSVSQTRTEQFLLFSVVNLHKLCRLVWYLRVCRSRPRKGELPFIFPSDINPALRRVR